MGIEVIETHEPTEEHPGYNIVIDADPESYRRLVEKGFNAMLREAIELHDGDLRAPKRKAWWRKWFK